MSGTTLLKQMEKDNSFYGYEKTNQLKLLKDVIRDFDGYKVFKTELFIDHDGYDKYGPESDIIDLAIWVKNHSGQHEVWVYHTEEWYTSRDGPPPFLLDKVWKVSAESWSSTKDQVQNYHSYSSLHKTLRDSNKSKREEADTWQEEADSIPDDTKEDLDDDDGCPCGCDQITSWTTGPRNCRTIVCTYEGDYVPANHEEYSDFAEDLTERVIAEFECENRGYLEER